MILIIKVLFVVFTPFYGLRENITMAPGESKMINLDNYGLNNPLTDCDFSIHQVFLYIE